MENNVSIFAHCLLTFIEMMACLILVSALLNKNETIKRLTIFSIGYSILYVLLNNILPNDLGWIICVLIGLPILSALYKEKIVNVGLSWLTTGIIVGITDCIVSYSMLSIFEVNSFSELVQNNTYYISGKLIISIITCIIAEFVRFSKMDKLDSKHGKNIGAYLNIVVTFMLLLPNIIILIYYHDHKTLSLGIVLINLCAIIVLFFVSTYNTQKSIKLAKTEQDLIAQQNYSHTQQDLIDGLRTFKHDYSNTLQAMYGYVQYNKLDKLKEMFEQVLDETKAITTLDKLNPNIIKDPGLFGILSGKYQKAKENNIKMEVEIFGDIANIDIEIFDLTRMLGILLDNAIEAAKESKKKKVKFLLSERNEAVDIEISNTYSGKKIDLNKIKEKDVSSKGNNRGLGLYKVQEIVNKYESVENITDTYGDTFVQTLTIKKLK